MLGIPTLPKYALANPDGDADLEPIKSISGYMPPWAKEITPKHTYPCESLEADTEREREMRRERERERRKSVSGEKGRRRVGERQAEEGRGRGREGVMGREIVGRGGLRANIRYLL